MLNVVQTHGVHRASNTAKRVYECMSVSKSTNIFRACIATTNFRLQEQVLEFQQQTSEAYTRRREQVLSRTSGILASKRLYY